MEYHKKCLLGPLTIGSVGVIAAAVADNPALLFVALFVYGAGTATNLQARYAGADLAAAAHRGRAVSTVLVATTLGGVVGPNLAAPTGELARVLGIPYLAGPFLLAAVAYGLAAVVLTIWLRPDPLLLARRVAAAVDESQESTSALEAGTGGDAGRGIAVGGFVMALTQLVMVAIMTMTPVHMLAAGLLAALAPSDSVVLLAAALALLGLGWNLGLVAGTAIITDTVPLATRAKRKEQWMFRSPSRVQRVEWARD